MHFIDQVDDVIHIVMFIVHPNSMCMLLKINNTNQTEVFADEKDHEDTNT